MSGSQKQPFNGTLFLSRNLLQWCFILYFNSLGTSENACTDFSPPLCDYLKAICSYTVGSMKR